MKQDITEQMPNAIRSSQCWLKKRNDCEWYSRVQWKLLVWNVRCARTATGNSISSSSAFPNNANRSEEFWQDYDEKTHFTGWKSFFRSLVINEKVFLINNVPLIYSVVSIPKCLPVLRLERMITDADDPLIISLDQQLLMQSIFPNRRLLPLFSHFVFRRRFDVLFAVFWRRGRLYRTIDYLQLTLLTRGLVALVKRRKNTSVWQSHGKESLIDSDHGRMWLFSPNAVLVICNHREEQVVFLARSL